MYFIHLCEELLYVLTDYYLNISIISYCMDVGFLNLFFQCMMAHLV